MSAVLKTSVTQRAIALRTRGVRHGPITRLVSPSDIGQFIKPFVFLDLFDISASSAPNFGLHPHSGIATLTVLHEGEFEYQETTGVKGILSANGIEWMRAGGGIWHTGAALQKAKGFQLWIALPEELENSPSQSDYLSPDDVPGETPARVILGSHGRAQSAIHSPKGINYLDVQLAAGERWTYQPPLDHEVAWLAVSDGAIRTPVPVSAGEFVAFEASNEAVVIQALIAGESQIQRIGHQLAAAGLLH